jgi:hypothetical protein
LKPLRMHFHPHILDKIPPKTNKYVQIYPPTIDFKVF